MCVSGGLGGSGGGLGGSGGGIKTNKLPNGTEITCRRIQCRGGKESKIAKMLTNSQNLHFYFKTDTETKFFFVFNS